MYLRKNGIKDWVTEILNDNIQKNILDLNKKQWLKKRSSKSKNKLASLFDDNNKGILIKQKSEGIVPKHRVSIFKNTKIKEVIPFEQTNYFGKRSFSYSKQKPKTLKELVVFLQEVATTKKLQEKIISQPIHPATTKAKPITFGKDCLPRIKINKLRLDIPSVFPVKMPKSETTIN